MILYMCMCGSDTVIPEVVMCHVWFVPILTGGANYCIFLIWCAYYGNGITALDTSKDKVGEKNVARTKHKSQHSETISPL
jgi:hypothetical protein